MRKVVEKKYELSNVIRLILLFVGVILAVFLLRRWYLNHREVEKSTPVLEGIVLHQIKPNELYSFVNEADRAIIYMSVSNNDDCRSLDKEVKTLIEKKSLADTIIYMDLSSIDTQKFLKEFNQYYEVQSKVKEYPILVYFEDAKIKSILSGSQTRIQDIENFLQEIEVVS